MSASRASALPITITHVSKRYGKVRALDDVSVQVHSGEFLTLLGPSGSGKTTLLMVLAGFTRPDSGSLCFGDEEVIRQPPHSRGVGMVFQNYALFPHMSVAGNISYPLKLRRVPAEQIKHRVEQALDTVQLGGFGHRRIEQLSGGQKQRVALARAIVFEPQILLMDEPLSALDKKLRDRMQLELRHLHEKLGMTTVYVTHDQREALTMSDRIAVINHGRVMQLGDPQAIYEKPANLFVADFIGDSTFLRVERDGDSVRYQQQLVYYNDALPESSHLAVLLRPERLRIHIGDRQAGINYFAASVTDTVYQGDSYLLYATFVDGATVSLRGVTRAGSLASLPRTGDSVTFALAADDTVLVIEDD